MSRVREGSGRISDIVLGVGGGRDGIKISIENSDNLSDLENEQINE